MIDTPAMTFGARTWPPPRRYRVCTAVTMIDTPAMTFGARIWRLKMPLRHPN
jgi:hypothetical protein